MHGTKVAAFCLCGLGLQPGRAGVCSLWQHSPHSTTRAATCVGPPPVSAPVSAPVPAPVPARRCGRRHAWRRRSGGARRAKTESFTPSRVHGHCVGSGSGSELGPGSGSGPGSGPGSASGPGSQSRLRLGLGLGGGVSVLVLVWGGAGARLRVGVKAGFEASRLRRRGVLLTLGLARPHQVTAAVTDVSHARRAWIAMHTCMCTTHQPLACGAATSHKTAATACMGYSHSLQVYQVLRTSVRTMYLPRALSWRVSSSQRCITAPLQLVVGR